MFPLCIPHKSHKPRSSSSPLTTFLFMCANFRPTRYDLGLRANLARPQVLFPSRRPAPMMTAIAKSFLILECWQLPDSRLSSSNFEYREHEKGEIDIGHLMARGHVWCDPHIITPNPQTPSLFFLHCLANKGRETANIVPMAAQPPLYLSPLYNRRANIVLAVPFRRH